MNFFIIYFAGFLVTFLGMVYTLSVKAAQLDQVPSYSISNTIFEYYFWRGVQLTPFCLAWPLALPGALVWYKGNSKGRALKEFRALAERADEETAAIRAEIERELKMDKLKTMGTFVSMEGKHDTIDDHDDFYRQLESRYESSLVKMQRGYRRRG